MPRFRRSHVLVVGDLMLDEFIWGRVSRISPEAPVPVVWVKSESMMPGGAANVANNIRSLGGGVSVVGLVGEDRWGSALLADLNSRKIQTEGILRGQRPTTVKTRVIAHHQQVVRVDREEEKTLSESIIRRLIAAVRSRLKQADAVVIEDYGKGVITRRLLEEIIPLARSMKKIITVDPKEEHFDLYHGVTALTPNRTEAGNAVGRELKTDEDFRKAGEELIERLRCEGLLMTLGEDGMCLFERNGRRTLIPTVAQEVFDVAGAGDTVIATFTLALAGGCPMEDAARLANLAAGIVVGKVGVAVITPEELGAKLHGGSRR
ncbi:MAG: D-glycero-beta-D-manno-heptose-7-phosphate kinase [Candidatus Omnitrophica bacterium]|nr:D-glycero-beta-D-manno-heptose-7-phosphate kinase [Candidatus Omnitrophota bacterium]MBI2174637.1 D-glycero-beta-D-manno-heptose-7-phosphate kinase [Candidatus Omnitrophota bacterium]